MIPIDDDPSRLLASGGARVVLAYEHAATAVGRLDAAGSLAPPGLRELLVLRCVRASIGGTRADLIALLSPDGAASQSVRVYSDALRSGAARARGGTVPSIEILRELLAHEGPGEKLPDSANEAAALHKVAEPPFAREAAAPHEDSAAASLEQDINALVRDEHVRTPPLLKAALTAGAILSSRRGNPALASLATALVLCVGGATTDAWLTLPLANDRSLASGPGDSDTSWNEWLPRAFTALAREARASERGIAAARERLDADREHVREALGRAAYSALDLLALLGVELVITIPDAARELGQTPPTTGAAVARLVDLGIAREVTGRARSRAFVYATLLDTLSPRETTLLDTLPP